MSGAELEKLSPFDLAKRIDNISIFYRMTPGHKMDIVRAFQASGSIVGMTGDGVNDAPALRLAVMLL